MPEVCAESKGTEIIVRGAGNVDDWERSGRKQGEKGRRGEVTKRSEAGCEILSAGSFIKLEVCHSHVWKTRLAWNRRCNAINVTPVENADLRCSCFRRARTSNNSTGDQELAHNFVASSIPSRLLLTPLATSIRPLPSSRLRKYCLIKGCQNIKAATYFHSLWSVSEESTHCLGLLDANTDSGLSSMQLLHLVTYTGWHLSPQKTIKLDRNVDHSEFQLFTVDIN